MTSPSTLKELLKGKLKFEDNDDLDDDQWEDELEDSEKLIKYIEPQAVDSLVRYDKRGMPITPQEKDPYLEIIRLQIHDMFAEIKHMRQKKMFRTVNESRKIFFAAIKLFMDETTRREIYKKGTSDNYKILEMQQQFDQIIEVVLTWPHSCCSHDLKKALMQVVGSEFDE